MEDAWLERWQGMLALHSRLPVLDLGCGAGRDSRFLTARGYSVIAADFSGKALELARRRAPEADVRNIDLTRGLPFPDAHFGVIVASLSLHYFPWRQTVETLEDVRRCLVPGGHFLARLNSTNDPYYTAAEKEEIEKSFYLVNGAPKRLFDRESIDALFAEGWELSNADERVASPYGHEKTLWEVVAGKIPGQSLQKPKVDR